MLVLNVNVIVTLPPPPRRRQRPTPPHSLLSQLVHQVYCLGVHFRLHLLKALAGCQVAGNTYSLP